MTASVKVEERNTWSHGYLEQAGGQDACAKATLAMLFTSFYYHGVAARDRTISHQNRRLRKLSTASGSDLEARTWPGDYSPPFLQLCEALFAISKVNMAV